MQFFFSIKTGRFDISPIGGVVISTLNLLLGADWMDCLRIIVADDDPDDYQTICEAFLEVQGAPELVHVHDGSELVEYLGKCIGSNERFPDLILLDVNMPRMNGVQALALIRENSRFEGIPIVIYTTASDRELMQKCYFLGANGYVAKGFTFTSIVNFAREVASYISDVRKMPGLYFYGASDSVNRGYS